MGKLNSPVQTGASWAVLWEAMPRKHQLYLSSAILAQKLPGLAHFLFITLNILEVIQVLRLDSCCGEEAGRGWRGKVQPSPKLQAERTLISKLS